MKNFNWQIILSVLAFVLIGYVVGFHHHRYLAQKRLSRIAQLRPEPGSGIESRLFESIGATQEQKEKLSPILQKRLKDLYQVNIEFREKRQPILDSMRSEIEVLLTPEQRQQLDPVMKKINRPFSKRKKRPRQRDHR